MVIRSNFRPNCTKMLVSRSKNVKKIFLAIICEKSSDVRQAKTNGEMCCRQILLELAFDIPVYVLCAIFTARCVCLWWRIKLCVCTARTLLCPSVRPSVTGRYCVEKGRLNVSSHFLPSGSHAIRVFQYQTLWQYSDADLPPHYADVEAGWVRKK